jgi:hypothetical protein
MFLPREMYDAPPQRQLGVGCVRRAVLSPKSGCSIVELSNHIILSIKLLTLESRENTIDEI